MGQDALNNIFEGLKIAQSRRLAQTQKEQEAARLQLQREHQEAQIKIQHETLDEAKKAREVAQKAQAAKDALEHIQTKQQIAANILKGIPVAGDKITPVDDAQGGIGPSQAQIGSQAVQKFEQAPDAMKSYSNTDIHELPTGDKISIPNPQSFARQQARLYEIANEPKAEATRQEHAAQEEARFKQAEAGKQADFIRTMQSKAFDDERAKRQQDAENSRAELHARTQIDIAKIMAASRNQGGGLPENFNLEQFTDDVLQGNVSKEDFPKLLGKQSGNIQLALANNDIRPLSKKQQESIGDYQSLTNMIDLMDQVIANQPQTSNVVSAGIKGLFSSGNTNVTTPEAELNGRITLIAKGLMKEAGNPSNRDIERAKDLIPSRYRPVEVNKKKRDDLLKDVDSIIDTRFSTVSKTQREIIKKRLGLDKYKLYGSEDKKPAAAQPAPQATSQPGIWTPQGVQWK